MEKMKRCRKAVGETQGGVKRSSLAKLDREGLGNWRSRGASNEPRKQEGEGKRREERGA